MTDTFQVLVYTCYLLWYLHRSGEVARKYPTEHLELRELEEEPGIKVSILLLAVVPV